VTRLAAWRAGPEQRDAAAPRSGGRAGRCLLGQLGGGMPATQVGEDRGGYRCHSPERSRAMRSSIGGWVALKRMEKFDF
jgi:hypothetical protein